MKVKQRWTRSRVRSAQVRKKAPDSDLTNVNDPAWREWVKERMEAGDWNKNKLAVEIDVSRQTIANILNATGITRSKHVAVITKVLGGSPRRVTSRPDQSGSIDQRLARIVDAWDSLDEEGRAALAASAEVAIRAAKK